MFLYFGYIKIDDLMWLPGADVYRCVVFGNNL